MSLRLKRRLFNFCLLIIFGTFTSSCGYVWQALKNSSTAPLECDATMGDPTFAVTDSTSSSATYSDDVSVSTTIGSVTAASRWCLSETQTTQPATGFSTCAGGVGASNGWESSAPTTFNLSAGDAAKTVYVWVSDACGNVNTGPVSDTITLDETNPTGVTALTDGTVSSMLDKSLNISWSAGSDAGSGIAGYDIAIGTSAGGTQTLNWTDIGNVTNYLATGLALSDGTTYYVSVRTRDVAGNTTAVNSDGWTIDLSRGWWVQEAYLKAPNTETFDAFGPIAVDRDTIAVGASAEASSQTTITNGTTASSDNSLSNSGAVYVFKRSGSTWAQEAYIKAANAGMSDLFGVRVRISGDTLVVTTINEDSNQTTITNGTTASADDTSSSSGAAYVYKRSGVTWVQEAYIKPPNSESMDFFGISVAISGDTIVAAASGEDSNQTTVTNGATASADNSANASGAAYVFRRNGSTWASEAYIKASNAEASDSLNNVDISLDTIALGAASEDSNQTTITNGTTSSADNSAADSGAVYIFKRNGTTWTQEAYIKAANSEAGDNFGSFVALSGDTLVVTSLSEDSNQTTVTNGTTASADNSALAMGAAYVYKRTGTTWAQEAYLKPSNGDAGDGFYIAADISQDTVVVNSYLEASNQTVITNGDTASADNSSSSGAVYVFKRNSTTWTQEAYIKSSNSDFGDRFGRYLEIDGDTIAASSVNEDSNQTTITNGSTASADNSLNNAGAAYVFKRKFTTTAGWSQQAYLKAPNADAGDAFGASVGISGDTVVVGAPFEDSAQTTITNGNTASSDNSRGSTGAAYVYKRTGNVWNAEAYLKPPNPALNLIFGYDVDIHQDTIVVGSMWESGNQTTITNGTGVAATFFKFNSGAVYVYKRTGSSWQQEAYIKTSNAEDHDNLARSVKIFGDTIVAGAHGEDSNETTITNGATASADNSSLGSGAVYIFKRNGVTWSQEAYIKAANAESAEAFGTYVGLSRDTVVVGVPNEDSNETTITNGTTATADNSVSNSGAVYVYKRTGSTWAQEAYIKAANAEASDSFGMAVNIDNDTIVVGAENEDSNQTTITNGTTASADNSAAESGAVYVYKRTGSTWAQEAYIKSPNAEAADGFGSFVSISGDTIVVGALSEDSNQTTITNGTSASSDNSAAGSGAAYVFKRTGNSWAAEAYLKPSNGEADDDFGNSVIDRDTIVVAATGESSNQTTITNGATASSDNSSVSAGAAYIFIRNN